MDDFTNQSPRNKVLGIEWINWAGGEMRDSMVVHLSDVRNRDTDAGVVVRGAMSSEDVQYAGKKMIELMSEATMTTRR